MTEIPEHLLARSKARRQAIGQGGGGDAAPGEAAASTAVEPAAPAPAAAGPSGIAPATPSRAPAAAAPPPPPPKRPEVVAAENRKKIPWWAVPALLGLPLWAFLYAYTLDPRIEESPVIAEGRELFTNRCASCHGATGGGGVGPALTDGAVVETFSNYADHVEWVRLGTAEWPDATYGDTGKPVGGSGSQMPGFGDQLSEEEILAVVRFEREVIADFGCEPELATETGEECQPGTEAETAAE